jgi:hypothetical protein
MFYSKMVKLDFANSLHLKLLYSNVAVGSNVLETEQYFSKKVVQLLQLYLLLLYHLLDKNNMNIFKLFASPT